MEKFVFLIGILSSLLLVWYHKSPINAIPYRLPHPIPLKGNLEQNNLLRATNKFLEGEIFGPESLAYNNDTGTIFTGLKNGIIFELQITEQNVFIRNTYPLPVCDKFQCERPTRPLGLRFRKTNNSLLLLATDVGGLLELDITKGTFKTIIKPGISLRDSHGRLVTFKYMNDFDELEDGRIIFSEPSSRFSDHDFLYSLLEHSGDGRLYIFDGQLKVLLDGLQYPNGVQLESNGNCVLVSEMGEAQIIRYCWEKPEKPKVLVDSLPGYPDNIRLSREGFLWVPLPTVRLEPEDWITTRPLLRNLLATV